MRHIVRRWSSLEYRHQCSNRNFKSLTQQIDLVVERYEATESKTEADSSEPCCSHDVDKSTFSIPSPMPTIFDRSNISWLCKIGGKCSNKWRNYQKFGIPKTEIRKLQVQHKTNKLIKVLSNTTQRHLRSTTMKEKKVREKKPQAKPLQPKHSMPKLALAKEAKPDQPKQPHEANSEHSKTEAKPTQPKQPKTEAKLTQPKQPKTEAKPTQPKQPKTEAKPTQPKQPKEAKPAKPKQPKKEPKPTPPKPTEVVSVEEGQCQTPTISEESKPKINEDKKRPSKCKKQKEKPKLKKIMKPKKPKVPKVKKEKLKSWPPKGYMLDSDNLVCPILEPSLLDWFSDI